MFGRKSSSEKAEEHYGRAEQEMSNDPPNYLIVYSNLLKATKHNPHEILYWIELGKCQLKLSGIVRGRDIKLGTTTKAILKTIGSDVGDVDPVNLFHKSFQSLRKAAELIDEHEDIEFYKEYHIDDFFEVNSLLGAWHLDFAVNGAESSEIINNYVESKNYFLKALDAVRSVDSKYDHYYFVIYHGLVQIGIYQMYQLAYNGFVKWNEMGQMDGSRIMFSGNVEKIKSLFADTCNYWRELLVFCPDNEFEHFSKGLSSFEKDWISKFEEK